MPAVHDVLTRKLCEHSKLDSDDLGALAGLPFATRRLRANEEFVRQGDKPTVSALVLEGWVARYHTLSAGKRQYLSFHMTGDMPDAQTLFIERMDHAVCALCPTEVAFVPHEEILRLFERRPAVGFAIWRETLLDAAIFREAITSNGSRTVLARLAHLFCELYYRGRVAGLTKPGSYRIPIHQGQIGEALGMSIVTVNRTLQELRGTNTMDFRNGTLTIRDWKKLTEVGDFDPAYLHLKRPSRL